MAGSPNGTSRLDCVLRDTQCRPPLPGTTIASPRYCWKISSISAVRNMTTSIGLSAAPGYCVPQLGPPVWRVGHRKNYALAIEAVVFITHQHGDRPVGLLCLCEGHRN